MKVSFAHNRKNKSSFPGVGTRTGSGVVTRTGSGVGTRATFTGSVSIVGVDAYLLMSIPENPPDRKFEPPSDFGFLKHYQSCGSGSWKRKIISQNFDTN